MRCSIIIAGTALVNLLMLFSRSEGAECPSQLKSALKPITEDSPLTWAVEGTLRVGETTCDDFTKNFNNEMFFLGIGYQFNPEMRIYFEGGAKYWNKTGTDKRPQRENCPEIPGDWSQKNHWGFRDFFFEYSPDLNMVRAGLSEMTAGDLFLVDERVLGGFGAIDLAQFTVQGGIGTVDRDFSRMGKFCGTRHNYRPLNEYYDDDISNDLWKTNLAFATIAWFPGRETGTDDEFSDFEPEDSEDEFETFETGEPPFSVDQVGLTFLEDFGSGFTENASFVAAFIKTGLPLQFRLGLEGVVQFEGGETATGYLIDLENSFSLSAAGVSTINGGYLGAPNNSDDLRFSPAFSNLFLGEALKLDSIQAPLFYGSLYHTIPLRWPVTAGVFYTAQTEDHKAREWDFEIGIQPREDLNIGNVPLLDHLTIRTIFSLVDADDLDDQLKTWKVEFRWAI